MKATDVLKHEHRIILLVLEAADREAQVIKDTGKVSTDKLDKVLDFCRVFIDACHHGKEEEYLFPKMKERGLESDNGPIPVMLQEHEAGRQRVKSIAESLAQARKGDLAGMAALSVNLSAYVDHLQAHIDKENNVLFPMADRLFTAADQQALARAFDKHEAEEMGAGVHEKYHQLAHELSHG
ncbi:MAG: hemerythrin domain-containing protein [Syntrophales bacterium]